MVLADVFEVYYSNVYYSKVGGVKVHEMNILECRFLELIGWSAMAVRQAVQVSALIVMHSCIFWK